MRIVSDLWTGVFLSISSDACKPPRSELGTFDRHLSDDSVELELSMDNLHGCRGYMGIPMGIPTGMGM